MNNLRLAGWKWARFYELEERLAARTRILTPKQAERFDADLRNMLALGAVVAGVAGFFLWFLVLAMPHVWPGVP